MLTSRRGHIGPCWSLTELAPRQGLAVAAWNRCCTKGQAPCCTGGKRSLALGCRIRFEGYLWPQTRQFISLSLICPIYETGTAQITWHRCKITRKCNAAGFQMSTKTSTCSALVKQIMVYPHNGTLGTKEKRRRFLCTDVQTPLRVLF